ncbi:MAG TPA: DUF4397 domain-containing protein [Anaerolineae bacterium]|nr:DUF4397 domain-containing protein [Anaerolineae bacterium]
MKKVTVLAALLSLLVVLLPGAATAQSFGVAPSTTLYFVHGITQLSSAFDDGQPVNVLLNDTACLAKSVRFGDIAGPFQLNPGDYKLAIVPAEKGCDPSAVIARTAVSLGDGENVSIVAHLTGNGGPVLTEFVNFGAAGIGLASWDSVAWPEFVVRNTSVLPMNVIAIEEAKGLKYAFEGLYPATEQRQTVVDGTWQLSFHQLSLFGSRSSITLRTAAKFDTAYFFYAVGSAGNGTFRVIQQALPIP